MDVKRYCQNNDTDAPRETTFQTPKLTFLDFMTEKIRRRSVNLRFKNIAQIQKMTLAIFALSHASACGVQDTVKGLIKGESTSPSAPLSLSFVESPTYNLGSVAFGASKYFRLSIQTTGQGSATVQSSSQSSSQFVFAGGSFPGTGGTCESTISGNCSVGITFTPTSLGTVSGVTTVTVTTNTGTTSSLSTTVSATVLPPALLSISDSATFNFGSQVMGTSTDKIFTLTNSGGLDATAISGSAIAAPYSFKGGTFPGTGGTCGSTLASGSTCTFVGSFAPTVAGASSATYTIQYHTGVSTTTATRPVTGTGLNQALITISDSAAYNYGNIVIGSTPAAEKSFTLTNGGSAQATALVVNGLAAPFTFKGGAYPGTGGTCSTTLNAAAICTVIVTFTPLSAAAFSDALDVGYNNGSTTVSTSRNISGTGVVPTTLTISDAATYNFGTQNVGTTTEKIFTITYAGTAPATSVAGTGLSAPYAFKGGSYPGTGGTCGATITSNCTIVVTYNPSASGMISDTIQINYNDGATTTSAFRAVQGTGQDVATLTISDGATFNFGTLAAGNTIEKTFTVTYAGGAPASAINPLALTAPYSYKGGSFPGTGGNCSPTTITANCTFVVVFAPTSAGTFNRTMTLGYNDGASVQSATRAITGTGTSVANLTISNGATYNFGSQLTGSNTDHLFTVTNSGTTAASSVTQNVLSSPYTFKDGTYPGTGGNCGSTIAASSSCNIVVTFSPVTSGTFNQTLTLDYDNGFEPKTATRAMTGVGSSVATLTISDGATYSFNTTVKSYTASKTFTISNTGGTSASSISETTLAAPFSFAGGSFPGTLGSCSTTITAGASCTVVVAFAPTDTNLHSGTLTLSYNNGSATVTVDRALSGQGASVSQVVTGDAHSCVLLSTGEIKCWGSDSNGQLGNDASFTSSQVPVSVSGITSAIQIAAGANHTCARLSNQRINCWGKNTEGQLGDGTFTSSGIPVQVSNYTDFNLVTAGATSSCAKRTNGALYCWGNDSDGQLGNGATGSVDTPSAVTDLGAGSNVTHLSAGVSHACARTSAGNLKCWGLDSSGELGDGAGVTVTLDPVDVFGFEVSGASSVYTGGSHSCLISSGTAQCFGKNDYGQLGNGGSGDQFSAVAVSGLSSVTALSLGLSHSCAIDSSLGYCWGRDNEGQLGDNAPSGDSNSPVVVSGISNVISISAGQQHSCAAQNSGEVYCWGADYAGQLGNGAGTASQGVPGLVTGL
jgi:alpha-tubulin suppressor-like RCC1 family protein